MAHHVRTGGLDALKNDPFVDITVTCHDQEWAVHKTYLYGESEAMTNYCNQMIAAEDNRVAFDCYGPEVIKRLLLFQYLQTYDDLNLVDTDMRQTPERCIDIVWRCDTNCIGYFPELERMNKAEITSVLQLNIQIWSCAKRFNIPKLEELALHRLFSREEYFHRSHLASVLDLIYAATDQKDTELRYRFFSRCVRNYNFVEKIPEAVSVIDRYDFSAWKLGKEYVKMADGYEKASLEAILFQQEVKAVRKHWDAATQALKECKLRIPPLESQIAQQADEIKALRMKIAETQSEEED